MSERHVQLGDVASHLPDRPWVLVLGGVTREGNRRARRAVREATRAGLAAIWFDGYEERYEDASQLRVELGEDLDYSEVLVVCYAEAERGHWLNASGELLTERVEKQTKALEEIVSGRFRIGAGTIRRLRMWLEKLARRARKLVLRRLSQIFRGLVGWSLIKADIAILQDRRPAPEAIVYGDDHAFTQAWRVGKIWTQPTIGTEFPER